MVKKHRHGLSSQRRNVRIIYLDGTSRIFDVEADSTLREAFEQACHSIGIADTNLFGLAALTDDNQAMFLDLDSKTVKQMVKSLKASNQASDGNEDVAVYLQVQYYVDKLSSIRDTYARTYYYRQLKRNFIEYPVMYPDDRCFLLAAYSMIAEDYNHNDSFDPRDFFPAWVVDKHKSAYIKEHLPELCRKFSNLTKHEAQNLVGTALCHETPIGYNMHLYKMTKDSNAKQHPAGTRICNPKHCIESSTGQCLQCTILYLGVGPKGVQTFEVGNGGFVQTLIHFTWRQIERIDYNKRRLELTGKGITCIMYSVSEDLARHVFNVCQQCHARHLSTEKNQFRRSMSKSFKERYREAYVHSESLDERWNGEGSEFVQRDGLTSDQYKKDRQKRCSIISDAASSSTSGIVSDRTCFSCYDSQEELLNGSKTITSSQDSLLEPSESAKSRPVQRATSEPSKKFGQLRELKVTQRPSLMSRAASDDTVRSSKKVTDHIYENISEVRKRLMVAAQTKPSKLSPRVLMDPSLSFNKPATGYGQYKLQVQSHGALNYSMGQLNQLSSSHTSAMFRSQYSIVKPSASMEQLLKDYQPPPSYSEKHKREGEKMFAAMSKEKITQSYESLAFNPSKTSSVETVYQKQGMPKPSECTCKTTSHPEIDKLREEMSQLPMISALFKDKNLQSPAACLHCNNNNHPSYAPHDRPMSWHSETFMLPNSLPALSTTSQDSY